MSSKDMTIAQREAKLKVTRFDRLHGKFGYGLRICPYQFFALGIEFKYWPCVVGYALSVRLPFLVVYAAWMNKPEKSYQ